MKYLYIKTYGCQMNVYDSDQMAGLLQPLGYTLTESPETADIALLNTCHIREKAAEKLYSDLGRLRRVRQRKAGDMMLAVAGCVAQAEGEEVLRRAPFVDIVVGPQSYHRLPELVAMAERKRAGGTQAGAGLVDTDFPAESKFDHLPVPEKATAASFLSIQEGCDKFCTFCVVPYTRGAEFSRPFVAVVDEARALVAAGAKELNLLGQNVNAWHGADGETFADLLYAMCALPGLERLRFTTSHPRDMDDRQIQAFKDLPQLMPYLHLPVQSGSNAILDAMNRKHTREAYFRTIDALRAARPDIALSSDFIVGFPGETDRDFSDTMDLVRTVGYAQAYSFAYSIRPGTPASVLSAQVDEAVKKERLAALQALLTTQQKAFNMAKVGATLPVLLEKAGKQPGQLAGRSPYMQTVLVEGNPRLIGQCVDVAVTAATASSLRGTVVTTETRHVA